MKLNLSLWMFESGTSAVDWCETNYQCSLCVAEFFNTFSNLPFLGFFIFQWFLSDGMIIKTSGVSALVWGLYVVIGVFSAYFHATLSFAGQLLDELSIMWCISFAYAAWVPMKFVSSWLTKDRRILYRIATVCSFLSVPVSLVCPKLNAFFMMTMTIPTCIMLTSMKRLAPHCCQQSVVSVMLIVCAVMCWIFDRVFCPFTLRVHFPYFHGLWHVLIAFGTGHCLVISQYLQVSQENPDYRPTLRSWPSETFKLTVPYITFTPTLCKGAQKLP